MKNFDWNRFTVKIAISAPMGRLYEAWSKSSEIEKWFLSDADYFVDDKPVDRDTSIAAGMTYAWQWYLYDVTEHGKILEANGKDLIRFTFAGNCIVDVRLIQQNEYIIVELTQKDIPTDDESKVNIRLGCHQGWSFYLVNLKSVYEGGIDLRNKDERLKPMLNN